jgi:hypothetical protein
MSGQDVEPFGFAPAAMPLVEKLGPKDEEPLSGQSYHMRGMSR